MTEQHRPSRRPEHLEEVKSLPGFKQAPGALRSSWRLVLVGFGRRSLTGLCIPHHFRPSSLCRSHAYNLNYQRRVLERTIADSKAQLALITLLASWKSEPRPWALKPRSRQRGLCGRAGYAGRQTAILAPPPGVTEEQTVTIKSVYRQSLWDWLFQESTVSAIQ